MARQEADREDLMREATALVRRIEFATPTASGGVVAGFRRTGELSIYFGADPTFQFDPAGRLRRAFWKGSLYRTQGTTLARLDRHRTGSATELIRHDLGPDELQRFLSMTSERLQAFRDELAEGRAEILRQVPADDSSLLSDVRDRMKAILGNEILLAPSIRGKR